LRVGYGEADREGEDIVRGVRREGADGEVDQLGWE
jgi:hypothetical protein